MKQDDIDLINETIAHAHFLTDGMKVPTLEVYKDRVSPLEAKGDHMPYVDVGQKFTTSNSMFFSLKSKGDKIRFRLLGPSFVNGKHFEELEDGKWNITPCPRINDRQECSKCNKYFEIIAKAKKTEDTKLIEQAKKDARKYQSSITFNFPVLDREKMEFVIFQAKQSIKNALDMELQAGVKVYDVDFIALRTEIPGSGYYKLSRVDSKDTPPLCKEELEEIAKYKKANLENIVMGTQDESDLAIEANVEVE